MLQDGRNVCIVYVSGRIGIGYPDELDSAVGDPLRPATCKECGRAWVYSGAETAPDLCPLCGNRTSEKVLKDDEKVLIDELTRRIVEAN